MAWNELSNQTREIKDLGSFKFAISEDMSFIFSNFISCFVLVYCKFKLLLLLLKCLT